MQEAGIGEEELSYLVNNNISFYKDFCPPAWKEALLEQFKDSASYLDNIDNDILFLFVEAMTDEAPWFSQIITKGKKQWLYNELFLIGQDLKCREREKTQV